MHRNRFSVGLAFLSCPLAFGSTVGIFATIPTGTYEIRSPESEPNRAPDERHHTVKLSLYEIAEAGVTQERYTQVVGLKPSKFKHSKDCPSCIRNPFNRPVA